MKKGPSDPEPMGPSLGEMPAKRLRSGITPIVMAARFAGLCQSVAPGADKRGIGSRWIYSRGSHAPKTTPRERCRSHGGQNASLNYRRSALGAQNAFDS